jgi:hypothetical protein
MLLVPEGVTRRDQGARFRFAQLGSEAGVARAPYEVVHRPSADVWPSSSGEPRFWRLVCLGWERDTTKNRQYHPHEYPRKSLRHVTATIGRQVTCTLCYHAGDVTGC